MPRQLVPAIRMLAVLTVLTGLAYPLAMTGLAQVLLPRDANGSIVEVGGKAVGSSLLGQEFTGPQYFHGRASAAGAGASGSMVDAAPADLADLANVNSGASNLGPTNPDLIDAVAERVDAYRSENGLAADAAVPVDAVTTSASGVDPHISVANARLQAPRVARVRSLPVETVRDAIDASTEGRSLGFLGEPAVNVLSLNLALDRIGAR